MRRVRVYNQLSGFAMEFAESFATVVAISALSSTGPADRLAVFRLVKDAHSAGPPDVARARLENILRQAYAEEDDRRNRAEMRESLNRLGLPLATEAPRAAP